jgi:hypothetical protein
VTIKRFSPLRLAAALWAALALCLSLAADPALADVIGVQRASLQADSTGWSLDANFEFDLNSSLEDAVNRSVSLYFTTDFTLSRPRWYWFDEEPVNVSQTIRLYYEPLTREYRVATTTGLYRPFSSLSDALQMVKHVASWHVFDRARVNSGETYIASVRMQLDTGMMAKPFQIDAVNNRDWNLASDWKRFNFTAAERAK